VDGKEEPDAEDETAFRDYLQRTYGINQREFPPAIDSEAE
jgi:hypothetical protein